MRLRLIACEVLAREVYLCAAFSPHTVDVELIEKGLHNTPDLLRAQLQDRIDALCNGPYDALILGYGLCGNALLGLTARDVRLVMPRAHDCITLYLGSRESYNTQFSDNPGTYYYTSDYIERVCFDPKTAAISLGAVTQQDLQSVYEDYVVKYGKDNADYLMEVMGAWAEHYSRAVFIDQAETRFLDYERVAVDEAKRRGWSYEKIAGSLALFRQLLAGEWPDDDFLVLEPGQKVIASYDHGVICAV